ncbi:TerD family protein [Rhodococcus sp. KBS0724]|uniref:TerD family protein n=1 Tax=Rhodococcus sp. KBS0724 TaxID=1179674 RepID=UPI00110F3417|nr:TerD family protein [Rhodococcus sp. KBS0724]TSD44759.1 TerD family protein [Rhodococcus sp. KBS0724]
MGMFSRTKAPTTDWATERIAAVPNWATHQSLRPGLSDVAQELVDSHSGSSNAIDVDKVVHAIVNIVESLAVKHLPDNADAISAIVRRPGPERDDIWNYFTHCAAKGVAVSEHIGGILVGPQMAETFETMAREGHFSKSGNVTPEGLPILSPDSSDTTTLSDPGLGENDPIQIAFGLMSSVGLSLVVYGPSDLASCFTAVAGVIPAFRGSVTDGGWLGSFSSIENVLWFGIESADSSAIIVTVLPDADSGRVLREFVNPLGALDGSWFTALAQKTLVPSTFADIFGRSVHRRIWHLPGLEHLRPHDHGPIELSWDFKRRLVGAGWDSLDGDNYKKDVPSPEGSSIVYFAPWRDKHCVFLVLGPSENGQIPENLRGVDLDDCQIGVEYEHTTLIKPLYSSPSLSDVQAATERVLDRARFLFSSETSSVPDILTLTKGANTPVRAPLIRVALAWHGNPAEANVDTSALLLGAHERVQSDSDFVFYNQSVHATGAVVYESRQVANGVDGCDSIRMDLSRAATYTDKIVIVGSIDRGQFSGLRGLHATVVDLSTGHPVINFPIDGLTSETALVVGELYRRNGEWKFRAVGQGYASGLRGVATDYGINVD